MYKNTIAEMCEKTKPKNIDALDINLLHSIQISEEKLSAKEIKDILNIEYQHICDFILFENTHLHNFARFYFTVNSIFLGAFFILIREGQSNINFKIIAVLSLLGIFSNIFWIANSARTRIKVLIRLRRAKAIEKYFKKDGNLLQTFTIIGQHLDNNIDADGKPLKSYEKWRNVMSGKFPKGVLVLWIAILLFVLAEGFGCIDILPLAERLM